MLAFYMDLHLARLFHLFRNNETVFGAILVRKRSGHTNFEISGNAECVSHDHNLGYFDHARCNLNHVQDVSIFY